ncbi:chromosome segregation protein SMC [Thermoactinomyces mirandus]|uniref:Chromosome partition protein Smc n=1 Tax=Thermoactinomyces mirandus TaxID=2756294 RepID=A0A7W1XSF1_9BACL|nr:chromosome segregation protein SMC [Thermoactinomyces mirandus]MBA4602429.1 chromosome segregation protein SMC [Thermoactinomyces mirandus]
MYLKRLEMSGFKSFADRTELEFVPGITAVVGPNGSGKSNVTDGIRWVLGEQSAKSLRGNKMEDVIFVGSDTRKPVGYCEVSMTFDNSERRLPVDYSEVTVTRRVYRSGESEYLLNRQPCRLKDIHELFMDTGIGKDAYSMIGQGKIDEILSSKSEDRRIIFEEAAGIVKYKTRKKEAEKKLDATEQNLARICDLIHEIETQIEPLHDQAEKARRYKELKEKLKLVEIGLYVHKIESLHEEWKKVTLEAAKSKETLVSLATEASKKEIALQKLKGRLHEQEKNWEQVQTDLLAVSEELEKTEGQKEVHTERVKNREQNARQLAEQIARLESELLRLREEDKQVSRQLQQKKQALEQMEKELSTLQGKLSESEDGSEQQLQSLTGKWQVQGKELVQLASEKQYALENLDKTGERMVSIDEAKEKLDKEKEEHKQLAAQLAGELESVEQWLKVATEQVQSLAEKRTRLEQEERKWTSEARKAEQKMNRLRSKLDWLKEVEAEHQGFMQGVKEVLRARDREVPHLQGIHGAVAELVQVPGEYEAAIETALGGAVQHVVVEDEATGRSGIRYLKEKRLGRATFLPLDVIRPRSLQERELAQCRKADGFVGVAADLVKSEARYRQLIAYLLGLVLVTRSLEQANVLARTLSYRYRVVTLDGDVVNPGGAMTGGSRKQNKSNLLGRSRQIDELEKMIREHEEETDRIRQALADVNRALEQLDDEWEQVRKQGEERRLREQELRGRERELVLLQKTLAEKEETLLAEMEQANRQQELFQALIKEIEQKTADLESAQEMLEQQLRDVRFRLKEQADARKEVHEHSTRLRIRVSALHQEISHLNQNQDRIRQETERLSARKRQAAMELEELENWRESGKSEMNRLEETIAGLRKKKAKIQTELDKIRLEREQLLFEREGLEKGTRQIEQEHRKQDRHLHELEVRANRLDVELNHLLGKLAEEYEISFERAKQLYLVPDEPKQAEKDVRSLKGQIAALGDVNLGAIEEYARLKERYDFLRTQEADLLEAKEKLFEIIRQLVDEMSRRFEESFQLIRVEFQDVFVKMFGGGRADLKLSDPENLLETGIDIVSQPPGKKLQNLNLLSGGERALTALALLFAVLQIRPVPFCVLDEVDAALDEANLTRYTRYMKHFSGKTQFIIITHRKHTMEGADVLYGITMQESGVSKLVSVKLEEYDKERTETVSN